MLGIIWLAHTLAGKLLRLPPTLYLDGVHLPPTDGDDDGYVDIDYGMS